MYMASKFEDVFPLHSKIVSEKIAHGSMTPKQVTAEEKSYFKLLDFSVDFVTQFDFFDTYIAKMQYRLNELCKQDKLDTNFTAHANNLIQPFSDMTMVMIKMSIQCNDFQSYSPSILVIASLYASTAFVKHSKTYKGDFTNKFCQYIRQIIFEILQEDYTAVQSVLKTMPGVS